MEELRKQIRALTNECNGLREILPRVKDKKGEDVVREVGPLLFDSRRLLPAA